MQIKTGRLLVIALLIFLVFVIFAFISGFFIYLQSESHSHSKGVAHCQLINTARYINEYYKNNLNYIDEKSWVGYLDRQVIQEKCTAALSFVDNKVYDVLGAEIEYKKIDKDLMLFLRGVYGSDGFLEGYSDIVLFSKGELVYLSHSGYKNTRSTKEHAQ